MANYLDIIARQSVPSVNIEYPIEDFILTNTGGWTNSSTGQVIRHRLDVRNLGDYTYSIKLANNLITDFKIIKNDGTDTDITYKFIESGNTSNIVDGVLTLSGDKKNNLDVFADFISGGIYAVCRLILTTRAVAPSYNLEQNLINCTSNLSGNKIDKSTDKEIILTSVAGSVFDGIPTITTNGNTLDFNLNNDLTVATITIDVIDEVVINAVARADIRVFITGTIVNATCNYADGKFLDTSKDIIISANSGFTFKSVYKYKKGVVTFKMSNNVTYLEAQVLSLDKNYYLNDNYIATKEVEQVGTFVNLYKTNQTELTELSKVRFSESMGQVTDYGGYINSLYILPFDIPSDILGDTSTILLGNLDSNVESTLIATYMYELEGGTIEVPLKYNNIYDFVNTECVLHLPFLDKIYLNSEYVIGQTLTILFTIELYSSNLTINVVSSFNNEIVASVQGLIGMNIPFIQKSNGGVINGISNVYKNKNNRCFVEVIRNIPYTKNNNVFGGSVVEYGKIGDYTGYLECDSLVLNTKATNQEQEEIKNIIRNGVFI